MGANINCIFAFYRPDHCQSVLHTCCNGPPTVDSSHDPESIQTHETLAMGLMISSVSTHEDGISDSKCGPIGSRIRGKAQQIHK